MNKKRLSLSELKIKSFITSISKGRILGGGKVEKKPEDAPSEVDPGEFSAEPTHHLCSEPLI